MKTPSVLRKLRAMTRPPHHENLAYNRDQWDRYAASWNVDRVTVEDAAVARERRATDITILGDEWGRRDDVTRVIEDFIKPFVGPSTRAAEIGSGGGRIARQVLPLVRHLTCFDISRKMLDVCRANLGSDPRVDFVFLRDPSFDKRFERAFDFVYSFDVWVHLDLHTMWKYLRVLPNILAEGGRAFLHTSNLTAPDGWANFAAQDKYAVETHYFITPQVIDVLLEHAGLRRIKTSTFDPENFYYNRDDLFVVECK